MDRVPRRICGLPRERGFGIVAGFNDRRVSLLHDDPPRLKDRGPIFLDERRRHPLALGVDDHDDVLQDIGLSFHVPDRPSDRHVDRD
jgi:hypothetical protein